MRPVCVRSPAWLRTGSGSGSAFGTTVTRARGAKPRTKFAQPSERAMTSELRSRVWRIQRRVKAPERTVANWRKPPPCKWKIVWQPAALASNSSSDLRAKLAPEAACAWTIAGRSNRQARAACQEPLMAAPSFGSKPPSRWVLT
ncbi:MAG: hypothetical protein JWQ80_3367 [Massilia sp.]|nr:hypothetical protein [Massilia sp.]